MMKNNTHKKTKIKIVIAIAVAVLAVGGILAATNNLPFLSKDNQQSEENAKTSSQTKTAQEDYSDGNERSTDTVDQSQKGSGGITDNGGTSSAPQNATPITSATGEISVLSPQANATISSGQEISGTSSLPSVTYRIMDDISGVIATGELRVVNGKFSGNINFNTSATGGRIDFYATRANGIEYSNVEVSVRFR